MRRLACFSILFLLTVLPAATANAFTADNAATRLADLWPDFKTRFVEEDGRVVDTANGRISHSEGQGYAMLLATAMNDRQAFDRVWRWTRQTLGVRSDDLFAWVYDPQTQAIRDPNNATDGDLLIAWALARAGERWNEPAYLHRARIVTQAILTHGTVETDTYGRMITPGVEGFSAAQRTDGSVFNLSYWVFPALEDLAVLLGPATSADIRQSGLRLLEDARFGEHNLPPDWVAVTSSATGLADGFEPVFGHNAIRIPLYVAWGNVGTRGHLAPFVSLWPQDAASSVAQIHLVSGQVDLLPEVGYRAIAELTACAMNGTSSTQAMRAPLDDNYYPAMLHLLSLLAFHERGLSC
ncbi:MAG: glycosyl hydrolase family 8 [Pseudomonadota bacterium]